MTKIQKLFAMFGDKLTVGEARSIIRGEKLENEIDARLALEVFVGNDMPGDSVDEKLSSIKQAYHLFSGIRERGLAAGQDEEDLPSAGALKYMKQEIEIIETAMMMLQPKTLN